MCAYTIFRLGFTQYFFRMMQKRHTLDLSLKNGLKMLAAHNYKAVHASSIAMIKTNVKDPLPYFLLGMVAADHNNHSKALELLSKAANYDTRSARYAAYYARALTTLGRQAEAKIVIDKAAKLPNNDAFVADTIGVVYSRTGYHEFAIPFFERAILINQTPSNFYFNLATSQQFSNLMDQAKANFERAIARNPKNCRAYTGLVALDNFKADAGFEATLVELFNEMKEQADSLQQIGHALAKVCEQSGRYEESLQWLMKGKAPKQSHVSEQLNRAKINFQAAADSLGPVAKNASDAAPIFIVGLPRTGTTLVDRIVSSHPNVTAAGELNAFASLIKTAGGTTTPGVLDSQTFAAANSCDLAGVGKDYIELTKPLARGAQRMTDKMPFNFFHAALIHRALPDARIIVLRRGAMDSCLSNYRQLFSAQTPYYDYALDLEACAQFYKGFDRLIATYAKSLPKNRFMQVRYEDIVYDQEATTRRLLEFCGLRWNEACMRFHENAAPVSTASSVQVRQPLYSGSIGRWKRYGGALDHLKEGLGDLAQT